jgi:hypothetical protein
LRDQCRRAKDQFPTRRQAVRVEIFVAVGDAIAAEAGIVRQAVAIGVTARIGIRVGRVGLEDGNLVAIRNAIEVDVLIEEDLEVNLGWLTGHGNDE